MTTKQIPLDQPNRRTVELLLRELRKHDDDAKHEKYKHLDEEADKLRDTLLSDPRYEALLRRKDDAYDAWLTSRKTFRERLAKVRRLYLSQGITQRVLRELNALVEEANS